MSDRSLIRLGVVAVAATAVAVVLAYRAQHSSSTAEMTYLIQGIEPAKIDRLVLGAGDDAVTLRRQEDRFVVENKDDYPALTGKISKLISSCAEVVATELITSDPDNHKELKVTEDEAETLIKFLDADGKLITGLAVGQSAPGRGSYVRALGSDDVYLCDDVPYFSTGAMDFIDTGLLKVNRADIQSVALSGPKGSYTLKFQDKDPEVVLENVPPGKKLKEADAGYVATRLGSMSFSDVMKRTNSKAGDLKFDRKVVCRLKDSTVYTLELAEKGSDYYLTCTAEYTGEKSVRMPHPEESEEELRKKEAKILAIEHAEDFAQKHTGWVYKVEKWQAEDLAKDMEGLLEDAEPETKPATQPAEKAPAAGE